MIFNQLSGKKKLQLLLVSVPLLLIATFQYGIRNTINIYQQYKQNYLPEHVLQQKMEQYHQLLAKEKIINKMVLSLAPGQSSDNDQLLLKEVTGICNTYHIKLKNYRPFNQFQYEKIYATTSLITLEGNFRQLLHFVNDFEKGQLPARIAAMHYKTTVDNTNNTVALTADIYLQQLQLINDKKDEPLP